MDFLGFYYVYFEVFVCYLEFRKGNDVSPDNTLSCS